MSINDLSDTIEAQSDRINAADLMGADKVIVINEVVRYSESGTNKFYLNYVGHNGRAYKPSLGMRRIIMTLWGKDGTQYIGRSIKIFRDPTVIYAGKAAGGVVISAMTDIKAKATVVIPISKTKSVTYIIDRLEPTQKPTWPDDAFKAKFESVSGAILANKVTHEQAITKLEQNATLTDAQKETIRAVGNDELTINEDEFESDD
tara:strand:+ start:65 stop:676 length:612 start_codon:yes stop_codon:yes gene_type:complete